MAEEVPGNLADPADPASSAVGVAVPVVAGIVAEGDVAVAERTSAVGFVVAVPEGVASFGGASVPC